MKSERSIWGFVCTCGGSWQIRSQQFGWIEMHQVVNMEAPTPGFTRTLSESWGFFSNVQSHAMTLRLSFSWFQMKLFYLHRLPDLIHACLCSSSNHYLSTYLCNHSKWFSQSRHCHNKEKENGWPHPRTAERKTCTYSNVLKMAE